MPKAMTFFAVVDAASGDPLFVSDEKFYGSGRVSPGSIAKIVCAALLLASPGFDPEKKYFCRDVTFLNGYRFTCSYKGGHATTNLHDALARSCNLYFQDAMRGIGRRRFIEAVSSCGLAAPPEAGKLPSEPDHEYFQAVIGDHALSTTPENLVGLMRHLAVTGQNNKNGDEGFKNVFSHESSKFINAALLDACEYGTAAGALRGTGCAGKTGSPVRSVSISRAKRIVSTDAVFAGYYPYIKPEYIIVVFMEKGTGGADAAKTARRIVDSVRER